MSRDTDTSKSFLTSDAATGLTSRVALAPRSLSFGFVFVPLLCALLSHMAWLLTKALSLCLGLWAHGVWLLAKVPMPWLCASALCLGSWLLALGHWSRLCALDSQPRIKAPALASGIGSIH